MIIAIVVGMFLFVFYVIYSWNYGITSVDTKISPNGQYKLTMKQIGTSLSVGREKMISILTLEKFFEVFYFFSLLIVQCGV